jgi:hypothetical protein
MCCWLVVATVKLQHRLYREHMNAGLPITGDDSASAGASPNAADSGLNRDGSAWLSGCRARGRVDVSFKNLNRLGRDMRRVIIIDAKAAAHPERRRYRYKGRYPTRNVLQISEWEAEHYDDRAMQRIGVFLASKTAHDTTPHAPTPLRW